ncbi:hypothetical protein V1291_000572 [Nitrobacteraceae bacterium AZCC 1564]
MGSQKLRLAGLIPATALIVLQAVHAGAQSPIAQQRTAGQAGGGALRSASGTLTGKERLGRKWSDEQRLDNCNVPIEKRGTRLRPSECVHAPAM